MKYKYNSNIKIPFKGKFLNMGDVIDLKESELKNMPYWRFKKIETKKEVGKHGQNMESK